MSEPQVEWSGPDLALLRRAIELSVESRDAGRHPFAALVADGEGRIVVEKFNNSRLPEGDPTQHAELTAVAEASTVLPLAEMRRATLVTSAEPCAMCTGAAYWTGIGRIIYGLSEEHLKELTGADEENPTLDLPCREVVARGQREMQVVGPALEDEARRPHEGFWEG